MRKVPKRKDTKFEKAVLDLLMPPNISFNSDVSITSSREKENISEYSSENSSESE
jgi:hypothetical protein